MARRNVSRTHTPFADEHAEWLHQGRVCSHEVHGENDFAVSWSQWCVRGDFRYTRRPSSHLTGWSPWERADAIPEGGAWLCVTDEPDMNRAIVALERLAMLASDYVQLVRSKR